jgi:hypothetical protein
VTGSIFLLAGSRSLGDDAPAFAWAYAEVRSLVLRAAARASAWLLTGGARGPDVWAEAEALRYGVRCVVYRPDGTRRDSGGLGGRWGDPPAGSGAPLLRNRAMVEAVVRAQARGWQVEVWGLVDATSRTRGTDHTLRLAAEAGLPVVRRVWGEAEGQVAA